MQTHAVTQQCAAKQHPASGPLSSSNLPTLTPSPYQLMVVSLKTLQIIAHLRSPLMLSGPQLQP